MTSFCICKKPVGKPGENCSVCGFLVPREREIGVRIPIEELQVATTKKTVTLYICPTPGCSSATIPANGEKLEESWTGPKIEDRGALEAGTHGSRYRHNRAECPLCRVKGELVQRIPKQIVVEVPVVGPPTPPLPSPVGNPRPIAVHQSEG